MVSEVSNHCWEGCRFGVKIYDTVLMTGDLKFVLIGRQYEFLNPYWKAPVRESEFLILH